MANSYPTSISPKFWLIQIYVAAIWVGQIGYCFLLLLARKAETKVGPLDPLPPLSAQRFTLTADGREGGRFIPSICQLVHGNMGSCLGAHIGESVASEHLVTLFSIEPGSQILYRRNSIPRASRTFPSLRQYRLVGVSPAIVFASI